MKSQIEEFPAIENVGSAERAARTLLGLGMIVTVLVTPSLSETAIAGLSLLSIYIMFTASTGWDPVYALMRRPQRHMPPVPPTATIRPRDTTAPPEHDFKRAA